jgi:antitoxin (DNA-binding transcriptional repressor) of toxin-antitoxin stability system
MNKVFSIDKNDQLKELVASAEPGEQLELTVDGKVVAKLVPTESKPDRALAMAAVERMLELRKSISLDGIPVKELTHGGHKY